MKKVKRNKVFSYIKRFIKDKKKLLTQIGIFLVTFFFISTFIYAVFPKKLAKHADEDTSIQGSYKDGEENEEMNSEIEESIDGEQQDESIPTTSDTQVPTKLITVKPTDVPTPTNVQYSAVLLSLGSTVSCQTSYVGEVKKADEEYYEAYKTYKSHESFYCYSCSDCDPLHDCYSEYNQCSLPCDSNYRSCYDSCSSQPGGEIYYNCTQVCDSQYNSCLSACSSKQTECNTENTDYINKKTAEHEQWCSQEEQKDEEEKEKKKENQEQKFNNLTLVIAKYCVK